MLEYKTVFTSPLPPYIHQNHIFFDIETTGLSPKGSILYLIGFLITIDDTWYQIQLFNEDGESEALIIERFFSYLTKETICIHYNGTTFDIPYLKERCKQQNISTKPLDSIQQFDYYTVIRPLKSILNMKDCKQVTVEPYAGFFRTDTFSGKQLIEQYFLYSKLKKETYLEALLLHNSEDLKGLTFVSFFSIFCSYGTNTTYISSSIDERPLEAGNDTPCFLIEFELPKAFPTKLAIKRSFPSSSTSKESTFSLQLWTNGNTCTICCSLVSSTLKFFYPNYKEYYYLPKEDMAIHKSVASFVEKEHRQKATKSNCYIKKSGLFLPIFDSIEGHIFYHSYKDKQRYLLLDKPLTKEVQQTWIHQALRTLCLPDTP